MKLVFTASFLKSALAVSCLALAGFSGNAQSTFRNGGLATKATSRASAALSLPQNAELHLPNASGTGWMLAEKVKFTYDAQGRETSRTNYSLANQPLTKDSTLFDAQGNEIYSAGYNWQGGSWNLNWGYRNLNTYNAAGKVTESISQSWTTPGVWVNSNQQVTTYNAAGYPLVVTDSDWQANSWVPEERITYTYGIGTNPPTEMLVEEYSFGSWQTLEKYVNLTWHDFDKFQPLTYEAQDWDGTAWVSYLRGSAVYDAFGGSVMINQEWDGLNWNDTERYTESFDTKSNYTGSKEEEWTGMGWSVDYEEAHVLTYNALDQITQRIFQTWDFNSNSLVDNRKEVYSNFRLLGLAKNRPQLNAAVYPNPATNFLRVQVTTTEPVTATLSDLTGRTVLTQKLTEAGTEHRIDLSSLSKGTYMLQLTSKKATSTQKVIKQ